MRGMISKGCCTVTEDEALFYGMFGQDTNRAFDADRQSCVGVHTTCCREISSAGRVAQRGNAQSHWTCWRADNAGASVQQQDREAGEVVQPFMGGRQCHPQPARRPEGYQGAPLTPLPFPQEVGWTAGRCVPCVEVCWHLHVASGAVSCHDLGAASVLQVHQGEQRHWSHGSEGYLDVAICWGAGKLYCCHSEATHVRRATGHAALRRIGLLPRCQRCREVRMVWCAILVTRQLRSGSVRWRLAGAIV